jgi:hypothetical protein
VSEPVQYIVANIAFPRVFSRYGPYDSLEVAEATAQALNDTLDPLSLDGANWRALRLTPEPTNPIAIARRDQILNPPPPEQVYTFKHLSAEAEHFSITSQSQEWARGRLATLVRHSQDWTLDSVEPA